MRYSICVLCGKRTSLDVFCRSCSRGAQVITASRWWSYPWGYDYGLRSLERLIAKRAARVTRPGTPPE
jgi:hypothetical protein